jgi:hypothetical protein
MGQHFYPCPTCHATQKVRAQSGEVVTIKDCDACAQEKARAQAPELDLEEALNADLDRYAKKRR